jgi:hypothetical protein
MRQTSFVFALLSLLLVACGGDDSKSEGALGDACYPNNTCGDGLECDNGTCVVPPPRGALGQECYQDGTCNVGLKCNYNDVCEETPKGGDGQECYPNGTCNDGYVCVSWVCQEEATCTPDCTNRTCGDNGCGGSCGPCDDGWDCIDYACIKNNTCTLHTDCNADQICKSNTCQSPYDHLWNISLKGASVKTTMPDGSGWDAGNGAPDLAAFIIDGSGTTLFQTAEASNSFTASWLETYPMMITKTTKLMLCLVDMDVSAHDIVGCWNVDGSGNAMIITVDILRQQEFSESDSSLSILGFYFSFNPNW